MSNHPYPEFFKPRQEQYQRDWNENKLLDSPVKSRYFDDFEKALAEADLLTIKNALQELERRGEGKTKIKILEKRRKQLESELEKVEVNEGNWKGLITPDLERGIHLTFKSPFGSMWMHHVIDSESIWEVADYFHARMQRHFSGDDTFVGSKDWDIVVMLHKNPAPPVNRIQVKAGDRVRLHKEFLPETLEWNGGVKGEVGECVVYSANTADGIYFGKRGVIVEVSGENEFEARFDGSIGGLGDFFTIPVSRFVLDRRLKPRELNEDIVFDVLLVHSLGIELSYEGSREYRVLSNAIREVLPEPSLDPLVTNDLHEDCQEELEAECQPAESNISPESPEIEYADGSNVDDRPRTKRPKPKFQRNQNVTLRRNIPPVLKGSEVMILQHKRKYGEYCYKIKGAKETVWAYECDLEGKPEPVIASKGSESQDSLDSHPSAIHELTLQEYLATKPKTTRHFQKYSSEARAGRTASHRLGHQQRESVGEYFYTIDDLPGRAYPSPIAAKRAAHLHAVEKAVELGIALRSEVLADYPYLKSEISEDSASLQEDLPVSPTEELDASLAGKPVRFELYTAMWNGITTGYQTKTHIEVQYSPSHNKPDAKVKIPRTDLIELNGQYVDHPDYQEGDRVRIIDVGGHQHELIGQTATVLKVFPKVIRLQFDSGETYTFYRHVIEPAEQIDEDAPGGIDAALLAAVRQQGGLSQWDTLKGRGATDQEIKQLLGRAFGDGCGSSEPHWWSAKGGSSPRFWNQITSQGKPDLQGQELVQRVRKLLEIPAYKSPTPETFEAMDAEYAEALESTPPGINLSRQLQDNPFGKAVSAETPTQAIAPLKPVRHIGLLKQPPRLCGVFEGVYYLASHLTSWQAEEMASLCPDCLAVWRSQLTQPSTDQEPEIVDCKVEPENITVSDRVRLSRPGDPIVKVWRRSPEGTWFYAGQMGYQSKVTLRPGDITCLSDIDPNTEFAASPPHEEPDLLPAVDIKNIAEPAIAPPSKVGSGKQEITGDDLIAVGQLSLF